MELVTIAQVRVARKHDELTGELVNTTANYRLQAQHVLLYDPPGLDGEITLDGEGNPMTSYIAASQALEALDKGFTEAPPLSKRAAAAAERKEEREEAAAEATEKRSAAGTKGAKTRKRNERAQAKEAKAVDEAEAPEPAHDPVTPVGEAEDVGNNRFTYGSFKDASE